MYSDRIAELNALSTDKTISFTKRILAKKELVRLKTEYKDLAETGQEVKPLEEELKPSPTETFSLDIVLNEKQKLAAEMASKGISFVLTGAAGTGKTTAAREIAKSLLAHGTLGHHDFKVSNGDGTNSRVNAPSIAFCAYTRRATNNIRRALHMDERLEQELQYNVVTVHRLLEYEPVPITLPDGKQSMRFEPKRTATNPLRLTHLVLEESSMLDVNLWSKVVDALPSGCQIIFLGDINQLRPVMGKSILSYALIKLPVIELTEVYRQALESDILVGAHEVLKGKASNFISLTKTSPKKQVRLLSTKIQHTEETLVQGLAKTFERLYKEKQYDPEQDIILSPFNKNALGTDNINNWIAQFLGQQRKATVHEVIAGRRKLYLAEGDRVMVDKRDGWINKISMNGRYVGRVVQPADPNLTRFGIRVLGSADQRKDIPEEDLFVGYENINIDDDEEIEEKKREASHVIEVTYEDGTKDVISSVGDFAQQSFSLGYALTVHKAQGCEWRKVYLVLHNNHAVMLSRELFYTAITRAKEELHIIAQEKTVEKAINNANIKGNTLEEKIEYFNSGALDAASIVVVPGE